MPRDARLESDPVDERAIIARCLAGERRAYALLVERYKGLVHDLVSRMLGDAVEAEDIAQDAFVKAYLSLKDFRGESRFSTLHRALARLPVKYREAVVLRHIEGMEFHEIGRVLGIPAGTAKVRAFRAREMLRRLLESEGAPR